MIGAVARSPSRCRASVGIADAGSGTQFDGVRPERGENGVTMQLEQQGAIVGTLQVDADSGGKTLHT
jgi:hypothetical protein